MNPKSAIYQWRLGIFQWGEIRAQQQNRNRRMFSSRLATARKFPPTPMFDFHSLLREADFEANGQNE